LQKTHASAVHVRQRAEHLLTHGHYAPAAVREVADGVTARWQGLVTRAEERHKLVTASLNFYKTAEQVRKAMLFAVPLLEIYSQTFSPASQHEPDGDVSDSSSRRSAPCWTA